MQPIKGAVQDQFGKVAANYRTSTVHATGPDLAEIVRIARLNGTESVLDVGCGAGHATLTFAPHVTSMIALDLTEAMLHQVEQQAAERGLTQITTRLGDVEQLPFEAASFDVVVSRYSAHHWPHPDTALREIARVLKPTGQFILSDIIAPADPALDTFVQAIELLRDRSHVRDHSADQWLHLIQASGLHAEFVQEWPVELAFEAWVTRMETPAAKVAILRTLLDEAPQEVKTSLRVQADYTFSLTGGLFHAIKS